MRTQASKLVLSLMTVALLAAPFAEAGRVGKGRSSGMQRNISSAPASSSPAYRAPAPAASPTPAMPANSGLSSQANSRSGPGIGTAVAAGVAGAAAGYMLGQALSDDPKPAATTTPAQTQAAATPAEVPPTATPTTSPAAPATAAVPAEAPSSGGLPWGGIALLLLLAGGAYMLMSRKKPATRSAYGEAMQRGASPFPQPAAATQHGTGSSLFSSPAAGAFATPSVSHNEGRLPDGTEVPHFLRQAKATFMHVQSMNNPANIGEIAKYMTPALFAELKADIADNQETADFPTLNCDFLESANENQGYVASVRFHGMVSESVNAPLIAFSEIWHYVKSAETDQKWLVAGIQQE